MLARLRSRSRVFLGSAVAGTLLVAEVAMVALVAPAAHAATLSVTSTADVATNFGACGSTSTVPTGSSLREAICAADNAAGATTVVVAAGTYVLTNGALKYGHLNGQSLNLTGAGAASTIIDGNVTSQILNLDYNIVGGVATSVSNVTIRNGSDSIFGGGGIIDGSVGLPQKDTLSISNSVFANNKALGANQPGGAVQMYGGDLTIQNTTFTHNSAQTNGSAVYFASNGGPAQTLQITGSTFDTNTVTPTATSGAVGGAVALDGFGTDTATVTDSTFTSNAVAAATGVSSVGGAILHNAVALTVQGTNFTRNDAATNGSAVYSTGSPTLSFNRFYLNKDATNAASAAVAHSGAGTVNAVANWWGCQNGPGATGCDTTSGAVTASPRVVISVSVSPNPLTLPGSATATASMTKTSAGGTVTDTAAFQGLPVSFTTDAGTTSNGTINAGSASTTVTGTPGGGHSVTATVDAGSGSATYAANQAPAITSGNSTTFLAGSANSFSITTSGYPAPAITETGALPSGVTFVDNGNGTATLSGTPAAGTGGTYSLSLQAANGVGSAATQTFTLTVNQAPAITSANTANFTLGQAGSFSVTATGFPAAVTFSETGSLPSGLSFTSAGVLSGTPTAAGAYPITVTASNGVSPDATQTLTINVASPPSVTTNPSNATAQPGDTATFTAAASGFPAPTVQWQVSTDGGSTFTNLAGAASTTLSFTASAGQDGNRYRAVFTNGSGSATTSAATLRVGAAPAFTNADHTTFAEGAAGSFALAVSGVPAPTVTATGLPAWLTLAQDSGGTWSLQGTPPAGSAGDHTFTLQAANGFSPDAAQTFTLTVSQVPTFTSADHTTFQVGSAGTFTVTTLAGFPPATTLTETGALPSGVSFTDNGDGTATLAGTPAAGTGGAYSLILTATNSAGSSSQSFLLTVDAPPVITSADHTTFAVGSAGSFTMTTTAGMPSATTITQTGTLPSGVTFTDNGDGTAMLAGTPAAGSGGSYAVTMTASNGVAPDATQAFTLTVTELPAFTSADHTTFQVGSAGTFSVLTSAGYPTGTTLTETGSLPSGVSFTDNGDGTGTLAGTPAAGSGGTYPLTLTGTNAAGHTDQAFTLTVAEPPVITSADHTTFAAGSAGTFTVTTTAGSPSATTITKSGTLPSGVSFTDNGDGTATLAGTPAQGTGGTYPLTITASNGVLPDASQSFTLTVDQAPALTQGDETFTVLTAGSTSGSASGFPVPSLSLTGALPSGITFTDNGDGSYVLAGTAGSGTTGDYPVTLTATNTAGSTPVDFTIHVVKAAQTITITSTAPVNPTPGSTYTPVASSDSGLPVAITIDPASASVCSITGGVVSFVAAGQCVIDFDQAGDGDHSPATRATQTVSVVQVTTGVTVASSINPSVFGQAPTATATVTAASGSPAGTVQFAVDGTDVGSPVTVTGGSATSAPLTGLAPGSHAVSAHFAPTDTATYAPADGSTSQVVDQAATTTTLTVGAHILTATVAPVAPGAGTPTGDVTFSVDGSPVGTATLAAGTATLSYTVPPGAAHSVAAAYAGDTDFTGSSASTSRHDPTITARVTSSSAPRHGWYRTPITVTFTCRTNGSPLVGTCPAPVTLGHEGAAQSVTRTIQAADGGIATVVVSGLNLDRTPPTVKVKGVHRGRTYGAVRHLTCVATDALSGVESCRLTTHRHGVRIDYVATATDVAGNVSVLRGYYRVRPISLAAPLRHGVYQVRAGTTVQLVVLAKVRPEYYVAAPVPHRPGPQHFPMVRAGHHRWALGLTILPAMKGKTWNVGIRYGGRLHVIQLHVR